MYGIVGVEAEELTVKDKDRKRMLSEASLDVEEGAAVSADETVNCSLDTVIG